MTADSIMSYPSYVNPQALTMFNVSTLLNQKDSRWLQLEVCREFQRQKCTRSDAECKFAHPPPNVEVQNGRVTACYDSIKVGTVIYCLDNLKRENCLLEFHPMVFLLAPFMGIRRVRVDRWGLGEGLLWAENCTNPVYCIFLFNV